MLTRLLDASPDEVALVVWRTGADRAAARPGRLPASESAAMAMAAAEAQIRQAFDAGVRHGEALGRQQGEHRVEEAVSRMARSIAEVAATRAQAIGRAEADVVRLSIEIARRVLHRELSLDPSALQALVRASLEKLGNQEVYRVRVHPNQAALVSRSLGELRGTTEIEVVNDPSQEEGGVLFESAQGALDASVATQLSEIERGLTDCLGERG